MPSDEKYNSYIFNKVNQYTDSDALRLNKFLNLYVSSAPSNLFVYTIENNSKKDLLITRMDFKPAPAEDLYGLYLDINELWFGFMPNPVDASFTSFLGPESWRILPAKTSWELEWYFGDVCDYTFWYYCSIYFSNGSMVSDAYEYDGSIE